MQLVFLTMAAIGSSFCVKDNSFNTKLHTIMFGTKDVVPTKKMAYIHYSEFIMSSIIFM